MPRKQSTEGPALQPVRVADYAQRVPAKRSEPYGPNTRRDQRRAGNSRGLVTSQAMIKNLGGLFTSSELGGHTCCSVVPVRCWRWNMPPLHRQVPEIDAAEWRFPVQSAGAPKRKRRTTHTKGPPRRQPHSEAHAQGGRGRGAAPGHRAPLPSCIPPVMLLLAMRMKSKWWYHGSFFIRPMHISTFRVRFKMPPS